MLRSPLTGRQENVHWHCRQRIRCDHYRKPCGWRRGTGAQWREWRNEWQISESVSTGSFFKALHRRGKNTATIKRKGSQDHEKQGKTERSEMTRETWQLKWNVISWILDHKKDLRGENWWNPNKSWSAVVAISSYWVSCLPPAAL